MNDENTLFNNGIKLSLLFDEQTIKDKVKVLAEKIQKDCEGEIPVFLCVLNGSFIFAADLVRFYKKNCEVSFIRLSSYEGTKSKGEIQNVMGLPKNIEGHPVIIVEDIVDTGLTMSYLVKVLKISKPKSVHIASLFVKPDKLKYDVKVDYYCFEIDDKFIVGYGLDYDQIYRNLPAIYVKD